MSLNLFSQLVDGKNRNAVDFLSNLCIVLVEGSYKIQAVILELALTGEGSG